MAHTFSGSYSNVTLSNAAFNPAYIAPGGTLTGGTALYGAPSTVWTLTNAGTIAGTAIGILIVAGGTISNAVGAIVSGGTAAIELFGGGSVSNAGSIDGSTSYGVYLGSGLLTNLAGADILGGKAVRLNAGGTAINQGTIGGSGVGITLHAGAAVTNSQGGTISGATAVDLGGGVLVNAASIKGGTVGGYSLLGGEITNQAGGLIEGSSQGIRMAGGSVVNAGQITASSGGSAIYFTAGGQLTNDAGSVSGAIGVSIAGAPGTIANRATIAASTGAGVALSAGGLLVNQTGGVVLGGASADAIVVQQGGTVDNAGTIIAAAGHSAAILQPGFANLLVVRPGAAFAGVVDGGNTVGAAYTSVLELATGAASGTLAGLGSQYRDFARIAVDAGAVWTLASAALGSGYAIRDLGSLTNAGSLGSGVTIGAGAAFTNAAGARVVSVQYAVYSTGIGEVLNLGSITGQTGVFLVAGGVVSNAASGTISGSGNYAVNDEGAAATVINAGSIGGTSGGLYLPGGGLLIEQAGAALSGATTGVKVGHGGTVVTNGSITGGTDAVLFGSGYAGRLVLEPGASFGGTVDGGNTIGASVASTLELASGHGTIGGVGSQLVDFGTISFDPGAAWLVAGDVAGLGSGQVIAGFASGDTIELSGLNETIASFSAGMLTLTGDATVTLNIPGPFTAASFVATQVAGGTDITAPCFVAGTRIATPRGEVAVERLRVGDTVLTVPRRRELIVWIGCRSVDCSRHPRPHQVWPVRIRAGAFGDARPCRDLLLSPDHAVFCDGVLIPVKHLINGSTIRQIPSPAVEYFHIELARHAVLFAEGQPAESYLDAGDRANFANGGPVATMYPDFANRAREAGACAPLVVAGATLEAVRAHLSGGAAIPGSRRTVRRRNLHS